ncbi:MAG: hypothetical protein KDC80_15030, partial [Saprospiraceae bacterium]|nr:hypothetical protein [Saprospiraceae bacterium]
MSLIVIFLGIVSLKAQSPHGGNFILDCALCHNSNSWDLDRSIYSFQHDTTEFPLEGQHALVDCKLCHSSLIFSDTPTDCRSCHQDIHNQTVGPDCARCHNSDHWLVENISQIHQENGFPLLGVHYLVDCNDCHQAGDELRFEPLGNECLTCHESDFLNTTSPNHTEAGYSSECTECHTINSFAWTASGFNHDFFPLTDGHQIEDCAQCHQGAGYSDISGDCISCHQQDFLAADQPDHQQNGFSNDCAECHSLKVNWSPAAFKGHDEEFFPIYSGAHGGEWDQCQDCHQSGNNYSLFTCLECHEHNQGEMDKEHRNVQGYSYNSTSCLACHPTGNSESVFDHSRTAFPLTGSHTTVECLECHLNGYAGTSTQCVDCHNADFDLALNPDHRNLNFSSDCASCHTTQPEWKPALMPNHNEFFVLNGAHAGIAADCASCHSSDFGSTPNTCAGCHIDDYRATTNPPHENSGFSDDCAACHSENAWQPASFDHDAMYFPIHTGAHNGTWNECTECHTTSGNYMAFSCVECHEHNQDKTDAEHLGISGYAFNSDACIGCHPTGSAEGAFDHNTTDFPLTGAHTTVDCNQCHVNGYAGTSTICKDCHIADYNQAINPNHQQLALSNDCASCHTTQPGWTPATFDVHNQYYVITGAHSAFASDCAACHTDANYANTPNTCAGCHIDDYNATTDPNHQAEGYSTECNICHSQNAWEPANFDHNQTNFPLTGAHNSVDCNQCHVNGYAGTSTICKDCHIDDYNQATNPNHQQLALSNDCASCHTTQPGWTPATFDVHNQYYVITG